MSAVLLSTACLAERPLDVPPSEVGRPWLEVSTLVVRGAEDRLVRVDVGHHYAGLLPNSRFVVIQGAGRSPMEERPEESLPLVTDFLSEQSAAEPEPVSRDR